MRALAQGFFERSPYLAGPLFTMVLFFFVFLGVVFYVMRSKKIRFDDVSSLPLADDTHPISRDRSPEGASESTMTASEAS